MFHCLNLCVGKRKCTVLIRKFPVLLLQVISLTGKCVHCKRMLIRTQWQNLCKPRYGLEKAKPHNALHVDMGRISPWIRRKGQRLVERTMLRSPFNAQNGHWMAICRARGSCLAVEWSGSFACLLCLRRRLCVNTRSPSRGPAHPPTRPTLFWGAQRKSVSEKRHW